jgi:hypothetical protein
VLDLEPVELREMVDIAQVFEAGIVCGHAANLVVGAGLVSHAVDADRAAADDAARERGLVYEHERVERISVLAEDVLDEPVVGAVVRRREERAIKPETAGVVGPSRSCCGCRAGSRR